MDLIDSYIDYWCHFHCHFIHLTRMCCGCFFFFLLVAISLVSSFGVMMIVLLTKKKLNEQLIRLCFCLRFFFLGFFFRKTKNSRRILFKSSQLTIGVDLGSINIHKISLNMAILTNQTNKITNTLIALSKHSLYSSSFFKVK